MKGASLPGALLLLLLLATVSPGVFAAEDEAPPPEKPPMEGAEDVRTGYERAVELYNSGRFSEALSILKEYVKKRPEPDAYYLIAYSYYKLGMHDEANRYFKYAFTIEPLYSPTPGIEERMKEPLRVARPDGLRAGGGEPRMPKVPRLIEDRPPSDLRKPAAEGEEEFPPEVLAAAARARAKAEAQRPGGMPEPTPEMPPVPEPPVPGKEPAPAGLPPVPGQEPVPPVPPPGPTAQTAPPGPGAQPGPQPLPEPLQPPPAPEAMPAPEPDMPGLPPPPPAPEAEPAPPVAVKPPPMGPEALELEKYMELAEKIGPMPIAVAMAVGLFIYLFFSYCLFRIARKLDVRFAWLAWLPFAQLWPFVGSAGKPWWWVFLLVLVSVIPIVNLLSIVLFVYMWMLITGNLGKNKWLGLLTLVPGINILFLLYLVFSKSRAAVGPTAETMAMADLTKEPQVPDLDFDLGGGDIGGEPKGGQGFNDTGEFAEPWPEEPDIGEERNL